MTNVTLGVVDLASIWGGGAPDVDLGVRDCLQGSGFRVHFRGLWAESREFESCSALGVPGLLSRTACFAYVK